MPQIDETTPVTVILWEGRPSEAHFDFASAWAAYKWIYDNDYYQDAVVIPRAA